MSALPFKLNQDRRRHIPEQKRRVTNWREYDESLRRRGSLTVWFSDEAVAAWEAERRTSRGGQPEYSDLAILTALTFKAVFRLAYRQTEGLIGSVIGLLGLDLAVPDHTTLCRRAETHPSLRPARQRHAQGQRRARPEAACRARAAAAPPPAAAARAGAAPAGGPAPAVPVLRRAHDRDRELCGRGPGPRPALTPLELRMRLPRAPAPPASKPRRSDTASAIGHARPSIGGHLPRAADDGRRGRHL